MTERLTVALEDGSIEKLRELAGGPRKVGAYLSAVTAWLWELELSEENTDFVGAEDAYQKLLALAGDESKLPAFVLELVDWLWYQKGKLEEQPLKEWYLTKIPDEDIGDKAESLLAQVDVKLNEIKEVTAKQQALNEEIDRRIRQWEESVARRHESDAEQLQGKDSQEDAKDNADGDAKQHA